MWISSYDNFATSLDDLDTMFEFYKSGDASEKDVDDQQAITLKIIEDIEFKNMLNKPNDILSCVLQINAGAGGTESCDWASMLMRMYIMWAEKHGFKFKELDLNNGDVAGIKSVSLEIEGDYAYKILNNSNLTTDITDYINTNYNNYLYDYGVAETGFGQAAV